MRKKNFLILLIVTIALTLLMIYVEKSEEQTARSKKKHFDFNSQDITQFQLQKDGSSFLDFVKEGQQWIDKTSREEVDSKYINELIEKVSETEFSEVIIDANQSLDQFRFENPAAQLTLSDAKMSYSMVISARQNFEGKNYLKLNSGSEIYTADSDVLPLVLNKNIYFQRKHLFSYELENIKKISIKSLNENFQLSTPLNKDKVLPLLDKLRNMTVQSYLSTVPLNAPVLTVKVESTDRQWTMNLSLNEQDKKLYAQITQNDKKYNVEYDTSYWEYFANLKAKQFMKESL